MPEGIEDDASDAVFEDAVSWLTRLREPGANAADRAAFARWRAADPRHEAAYAQAERLFGALARPAAELARRFPAMGALPPRRRQGGRRLAAAAIAAMLALGAWLGQGGFDDLRSDHMTGVGERAAVTLDDGSEVALNTDSALAVDLAGTTRRVALHRGEAFFRVARDAARPFIVATPEGEIRVTGTAFNVRVLDGHSVVSVVEGQVEVTASPGGTAVRLGPGRQVALAEGTAEPVVTFDATALTAWRRGQVVFYRTRLGEVVDELNRYQHGRVLVLSRRARALRVTGVFDADEPAAVIAVIEATLPLEVTRFTDHLILLR